MKGMGGRKCEDRRMANKARERNGKERERKRKGNESGISADNGDRFAICW